MGFELFKYLGRRLLVGSFIVGCLMGVPAFADDFDDSEEEVKPAEADAPPVVVPWEESEEKKEVDRYHKEVIQTIRKEVEKAISPQYVVEIVKSRERSRLAWQLAGKTYDFKKLRAPGRRVDWSNFDKAPTDNKDKIVARVREAAKAKAIKTIEPERRKQEVIARAAEIFQMYRIGDLVSLELRSGVGVGAYVDNQPLHSVNEERIIVGKRHVIRDDISLEDQAKFYDDLNAKMREEYVANQQSKVDAEVESFVENECFINTAPAFLRANYIPDITNQYASMTTAKPEYWIPKRDFINRLRKTLIDLLFKERTTKEVPQKMKAKGYVLVKTKDGKGEEWVTQAEKTRREAPPTDPNAPGGAPGGAPGAPMPPQ